MAHAQGPLQQQQQVLWEGTLEHQQYGELTAEATFAQPVLVTGIRGTACSLDGFLQLLPQLLKGFAKDLHTTTAARFAMLFNAVSISQQETQEWRADELFPTQHVWLRARCRSIKVQLLGYALNEVPQHIRAAAEARFCPLPDASPLLSLPSAHQDTQQLQVPSSPAAAPSLPRPPGKQLPLGKIPPAFVLTLAPLAKYWQDVCKIPLPPGSPKPSNADLLACQEMADAVLGAQRGSPAGLKAKLANTRNVRGLAVDWDGIRDSVLDMATYCCSALGDNLVDPIDLSLASAGVCAAIMLAACQDGAAQFLAWPSGGIGVAGAIAVKDLVSIPNQPGQWQAWSIGLVDLLLESCPAVAGPTLQGTLNPAAIPEPEPEPKPQESDGSDAEAEAGIAAAPDADASRDGEHMLVDGQEGDRPEKAHSMSADGASEPAASGQGADAAAIAPNLPAAKRPRVCEHAASPADAAAYGGTTVAADATAGLMHAESTTGSAAAAALAAAAADGTEVSGQQPLPLLQQQLQDEGGGSDNADDDALLACLDQDSDNPDNDQTGPDAARRKRQKLQQDADGVNGGQGFEQHGEDDRSDWWDPHELENQGSEEAAEGTGQQEGSKAEGKQQQVALEEGDYPEADEEAIRLEAAAKAARRGVGRRPPVCALARGQLYTAIMQLAMSPLQHNAAISCQSVLRRLRAYQCLDALQAAVGPLLSGRMDPLQLKVQELCTLINQAAAAANDLAALVLQPSPSSRSLFLYNPQEGQAAGGSLLRQQPQEADHCVLQLLLSFRALEMLGGLNCCIGVHMSWLARQQQRESCLEQQDAQQAASKQLQVSKQQQLLQQQQQQQCLDPLPQQQPQEPTEPPDKHLQDQASSVQQSQLCREHAQLLDCIRTLTSALTASSGGWCFLTAARDGLAALAAAICPTRQVCLDGGPFSPDTSAPYDTQHGWEAERQALTAAASGLGSAATGPGAQALLGASSDASAAAGDLSDSLQRVWLLVEATAQLQGAEDVLSGNNRAPGAVDKLNAAMKTLFVGGFASELGQRSLVAALSACSPAVHQLGVLLKHCSEVHAAAAAGQHDQGPRSQDRALSLSLGLRLGYGALYAPEILLAFMTSPHIDAIATWLPLTDTLHEAIREHLYQYEVSAATAAKAAFPNILSADPAVLHECGLATAILPGGAAAAKDSSELVLLQLHGAALTAHNLVQLWQGRAPEAPLGAGSAGKMLDWLHAQLPKLESVESKPPAVVDPEGVAPKLPKIASSAFVAVQAADATSQLDGAAASGGAPPPADKDVKSDAVVEFMRNAACRSAALCALHILDMLLRGAPDSVRAMARKAHKQPRGANRAVPAFRATFVLPDGPARQGVTGDAASQDDGFAVREVVRELLEGVAVKAQPNREPVQVEVFELLERALRTATVALRASDADLVWSTRGANQQDILSVLQGRTAAAALMRAACATTASLLLHLSDAHPRYRAQSYAIQNDSLMDALICAHSAVVSCHEGLQACVPHPQLAPSISRATDPGLKPVQRAAADGAVASASVRVCGGRVLLLLEARQALSVCLRCWQLQGWWPDPVGALMGAFPRASAAGDEYAREDAAAQKEGDPSAPPAPAPRQGPRQLLSSLMGLADLCPEEWPPRGASKAAAKQRDADGDTAFGGKGPAQAFERPSLIFLRQAIAKSLEVHWDRLERLIDVGLSCSTRLARLAVVRMLTRMAGLGAGVAPLLGPKVLLALCSRLHTIQQLRKGLSNRLHAVKALAAPEGDKQQLIDQVVNTLHLQLRGTAQVCEVLLPLCGAPSIKSVLTEHKAAGVLGKAVYALVRPLADLQQLAADKGAAAAGAGICGSGGNGSGAAVAAGLGLKRLASEAQLVAGLLLQLVGSLMDADISMNPWADRSTRQLHDTPSIFTSSITAAWLLAAAPNLNPANMAALAQLLVGHSTAATVDAPPAAHGAPVSTDAAGQQATQAAAAAGSAQPAALGVGLLNGQSRRGDVCLTRSAKGRVALLQVGHHWRILGACLSRAQEVDVQSRPGSGSASAGGTAATAAGRTAKEGAGIPLACNCNEGRDMTQSELKASAEWAAAALESTQYVGGPDATHAAGCAAIAQVLRELHGSSSGCAAAWQEYEAVVQAEQELKPQHTWAKFITAAKSAAAAHQPGGSDQQSLATLLSSPPLLLACNAATLAFWAASAASEQHAAGCSLSGVCCPHNAAQPTASASGWWPRPQLVAGSNPPPRSQAIADLMRLGEEEDKRRRDRADAGRPDGGGDDGDDGQGGGGRGGFVPAVYAQRGPQFLKDDQSSRKASKHVDNYQREAAEKGAQKQKQKQRQNMPPPPPRHPMAGGPPPPGACYQCGQEGHIAKECPMGPKCFKCGQQGHLARDCPKPGICHKCGEAGHLITQCKVPAGFRRRVPAGMRPGPPPDGPGHGSGLPFRDGPGAWDGPGLTPPPPPSGPGVRGGPVGHQLPRMQQALPPHQLSPRGGSGSVMRPPADPRLRRQLQQQQGGGGASVSPSPGRSPSSPRGGSGALLAGVSGGFGAVASGVLLPALGSAATPPAPEAVAAGGVAVTPGAAATAPAAVGGEAGGVRSSSYDQDAALLRALEEDSQDELQDGYVDGSGGDHDDGAGIGDFLDGLIGGANADEDMAGGEGEGAYDVSEAGGL